MRVEPGFLILVGVAILAALLLKSRCERLRIPPLVSYLLLGVALRILHDRWGLLDDHARWGLGFLAEVGVFCLLFRVGLECNPGALLRQLRPVIPVWVADVLTSAVLGYLAARYLLGLDLGAALAVSTALSATSLGVSVVVWEETGRLRSRLGERLIDLAELDDLSAIALLSLLLAALPYLGGPLPAGVEDGLGRVLLERGGALALKAALLGSLIYLLSRFALEPMTRFLWVSERAPDPLVSVVAIGLVVAAVSDALGLSLAVGALFAGLGFGSLGRRVEDEASFLALYDLFTPFFFLGIGVQFNPTLVLECAGWGALLLVAALLGKLLGAGLPFLALEDRHSALLVGVSMLPRAEIALVVAQTTREAGVLPESGFGGLVFVSASTCLLSPLLLQRLLRASPALDCEPGAPPPG
ncbi:MAG: cation:proton antiporter [Planctomycetota bacterium]